MFGWYKLKKFYPRGINPSEVWDRQYETDGLQWDDPEEYRRQLFYPLLTSHLEKGKKYLDAGSGLGGWLSFLRARGFEMVGVESSRRAVELAKKLDPTLPIELGDISKLSFEADSFDGYVSIGSWEYVEDGTEQVVQEAARVLKPGGVLLIEVPYGNPLRRLIYFPLKSVEVWFRSSVLGRKSIFSHHIFRKGDITELLKECGFEIMEMNPHELPDEKSHYGLWVDWPFLRGGKPYKLNGLGVALKRLLSSISPWMIATGIFFVATKK